MRLRALGALALLWQSSLVVDLRGPARPEHLRFQRHIQVLSPGSGTACVTLDATVLAHTASGAHSDLRLFRKLGGEPEAEFPYNLTESGPEPVADTAAVPEHVLVHGSELSFDLRMPPRPYSEVRLKLRLRNFVATATTEGRDRAGKPVPMGSVALYDLSAQHLGRWTSLLLAEAEAPVLHVVLDLRSPDGTPFPDLAPTAVEGAEVPPSRLRQTRYVPTESTATIRQQGVLSIATLQVPAHVPVERVLFRFDPEFHENFARDVSVSARPAGAPITDTEALEAGEITHVQRPSGDPRLYPIDQREDALDATMGATLVRPATVLVAVDNTGLTPLPIREVTLEMRERKLCFFADREATFMLRYGDPGLQAPQYDEPGESAGVPVLRAELGPEQRNPAFTVRPEAHDLLRRHPEWFWLLVLVCAGSMGGSMLHYVQHRRG